MADLSIKCPHCGKEVNDTVTSILVQAVQESIEMQVMASVAAKIIEDVEKREKQK